MGFRFWRRKKILPGITLNLSKSGPSLSFGVRGAKFTIGHGGKRVTAGIPGTGMFYTKILKDRDKTSSRHLENKENEQDISDGRLTLGFFKKLVTPEDERAFVDGCREFSQGNEDKALESFEKSIHLADGAYMAALLAFRKNKLEQAAGWMGIARKDNKNLGKYFSKYGMSMEMVIPITDEMIAYVKPELSGVLLILVEIYQRQGRWHEALECLKSLRSIAPEDLVVKLSLVEVLMDAVKDPEQACKKVIEIIGEISNESPLHAALMLYKAKAFIGISMFIVARDILTAALRRKKNMPLELLNALRYERALAYKKLGKKKQARSDLERIYANDPDYEDVAEKLGIY